jgi:hypothetical protein
MEEMNTNAEPKFRPGASRYNLVVLVFWLTALFPGFGLFARRNLLVVAALGVCALTVSTAVLLIIDMDQPLSGFMKLATEPLRNALVVIGDHRCAVI